MIRLMYLRGVLVIILLIAVVANSLAFVDAAANKTNESASQTIGDIKAEGNVTVEQNSIYHGK